MLCHPINCRKPPQSPPSPQAMQSPIPTQPGQNRSVSHSTSHSGTGHEHPPGTGSWDEALPEAPLPQNCSTGAFPKSLQLLPPCQAAGQAKFCRQLPESREGIQGVPQGSTLVGSHSRAKSSSGFKAGQEGGQVSPSQGRGLGRGQRHMGSGIWLQSRGPAASSLPTAWPAARSIPARHSSSQGVLRG